MPTLRSRRLLVLLAVGFLAAAAAVAWWYFMAPSGPSPPVVPADGLERPVVEEIEKARQKVLRQPRSASAWGELGKLFRAHACLSEANVCLAEAARLAPSDSRWPYLLATDALLRAPDNALPPLRRAVEVGHADPEYRAAAQLRLAEALLERQELDEAERLFRQEQQRNPGSPRAAYGLALIAAAHDDLPAAVAYLTPVASSPFVRKKASAQLALLHRRLGNAEAVARYQREATRPPDDLPWPDPYITEVMRVEAGRHSRMTRATELEAQGRLHDAIVVLTDVVRQYPDERSYVALGITLAKARDYPAAEEMLRTTLRLAPEHVQGHYFLGVVLFMQAQEMWSGGDSQREQARVKLREADAVLKKATELKPDHALAWYYRGRALRYLDDRDAAIVCLRQAVLCRPESPDPILYLAESLAEAGRRDEAMSVLRSAMQGPGPLDPRLKETLERIEKGS